MSGAGLLVLLAALPGAADFREACDDTTVARTRIVAAAQAGEVLGELDRRAQLVLAEERRLDGEPAPRWPTLAAAVAAAGLLVLGLALTRRRAGPGLVGLLVAAGAAAAIHHHQRRDEARAHTLVTLARCRLMLAESRQTLLATQLGNCSHRVGEVDEDLAAWEGALRAGTPVTLPQVLKMRGELKP